MECVLGGTGWSEGCWGWVRVHAEAQESALFMFKKTEEVQWVWRLSGSRGHGLR